jgi:hypothetical protein
MKAELLSDAFVSVVAFILVGWALFSFLSYLIKSVFRYFRPRPLESVMITITKEDGTTDTIDLGHLESGEADKLISALKVKERRP